MAYGIRISKDGIDATKPLTEANKKDFVFISDSNSPKVVFSGFLEGSVFTGVSYDHNLGYIPMFFLYSVDSVTTPTTYTFVRNAHATTTSIAVSSIANAYLIILKEGN